MKVKIIDCETFETMDGRRFTTNSRPSSPPPDGDFGSEKYGWHDVLCKWMPIEDLGKSFIADVPWGQENV